MIGQTLSHYRITAAIGSGGMGEVYRATDTKLGREVAIKVLPPEVARDPERLARFQREAQVLASLNHPNVAAIHGLEEAEGKPFLVLELVEGEDLRERLTRGAIPLDEAIDAARQIAEALEEAHEKGIVHRDLKPANVKRTPDGKVKVLDFGLARAYALDPASGSAPDLSQSPTLAQPGTQAGVILGTAAYMSPEQARGKPVDKRADIWAFGAVLYEMIVGRPLFEGETVSDLVAAVLTREPDWSALPSTTPAPLRRLLRRCLDRDPRQRLRDIGEARIQLARGREEEAAPGAVGERPAASPTRGRWVLAAAVGVLAFAAGYALRRPPSVPPLPVDPDSIVRQLTFEPGLETEPSFSPDGNYIAYTTNERGTLDIAVLSLAGGPRRHLVATEADEAHPDWSPDGSRVAFTSARDHSGRLTALGGLSALSPFVPGQGGDIFIVPAAGGAAVKLVEGGSYPAWSPDGETIAFQGFRRGQWDIWTVPSRGGEPRRLNDDADIDYQPAWSPDGRWIAYASLDGLKVAQSDGSAPPYLLTEPGRGVAAPAWSPDGRWIVFASTRNLQEGTTSLWRVAFPPPEGRSPLLQRITLGESTDVDPALAAGGRRLAYGKVEYAPDLWELDVRSGERRQLTFTRSGEDYPHLSPDGQMLLFFSDRSGYTGIWTIRLDGTEGRPLTPSDASAVMPRWSPDGRRFAFIRRSPSGNTLSVQPVDGLTVRDLVTSQTANAFNGPEWRPDGRALAYSKDSGDGTAAIWVTDLDDAPRQVAAPGGTALFPTWSPDGRRLAFQHEADGPRQIWLVAAEGGDPRPLTSSGLEHSHPQWSPVDPDRILVVIDHKNLAVLSVSTGRLEYVTHFDDSTVYVDYPSWSPDGSKIYFSMNRKVGDLILIESGDGAAAR